MHFPVFASVKKTQSVCYIRVFVGVCRHDCREWFVATFHREQKLNGVLNRMGTASFNFLAKKQILSRLLTYRLQKESRSLSLTFSPSHILNFAALLSPTEDKLNLPQTTRLATNKKERSSHSLDRRRHSLDRRRYSLDRRRRKKRAKRKATY